MLQKLSIMITLISMVLVIHEAAAVKHSLQYFYTASSGSPNLPEFLTVGMVDGQPISYYDSVSKQDWMNRAEGPEYWELQTQISRVVEQSYKTSIDNVRQRLNQREGVRVVQRMYGCYWDDETGETSGYNQYGYDGEDFLSFDLKQMRWIAAKQQAADTKTKWDHKRNLLEADQLYLTQECPEWLKKYVNYGKSSLLRTDLPSVSLLQKSPSCSVSCHATGFYPDRAEMFWRKDGEELHEDVDKGEILPNHDGSFQMRVDLNIPSVRPEDWHRYDCVFQLSGVKNDIVTKLDKPAIRSNEGSSSSSSLIILNIIIVGFFTVFVAVIGFFVYRKEKDKRPPSPVSNPEVMEQLNPVS